MKFVFDALKSLMPKRKPMSVTFINAAQAHELVAKGATLVDVRESGEFAAERIPNSINAPLSRIAHGPLPAEAKKPMIFFCLSGARTRFGARTLDQVGGEGNYIMDDGFMGWKRNGFPTAR